MNSNPKVAIISGNLGRWSAKDRPHDIETQNGVEAWVHTFNGDYINYELVSQNDIANYDIIIANTIHLSLPKLVALSQARPASVKWVLLIEGSATDYLKPMPFFREALNSADLVNVINRYTVSFFQAMTTTKCAYIGIPYPVEFISKLAVPFEKRTRKIFLCPLLSKRWTEHVVAKALGMAYYGYEQRVTRKLSFLKETWQRHRSFDPNKYFKIVESRYNDKQLEVRRDVGQREFFEQNADAWMWLNLDERYTWGRYVLDAAALQIPIITTRSTGHGEEFFPETTLEDEFQIDKAIAIGKRLVSDEEFYRYVATYPNGKMAHLMHHAMKQKLLSALD